MSAKHIELMLDVKYKIFKNTYSNTFSICSELGTFSQYTVYPAFPKLTAAHSPLIPDNV